jgi:winged helix-turn-helix DNA-binding protein
MIARPDPAITFRALKSCALHRDPEIVALFTELRSGRRHGEIPAVTAEVSRKLVEDYGITIAEIARQLGVSTSAISKRLPRSYSS